MRRRGAAVAGATCGGHTAGAMHFNLYLPATFTTLFALAAARLLGLA
jgi:hypothetical protein